MTENFKLLAFLKAGSKAISSLDVMCVHSESTSSAAQLLNKALCVIVYGSV